MGKPILGYWDIRGLCNPIRFLLAYLGIDYEEKLYSVSKPPYDGSTWFSDKFKLGLPFPNLPYWIEGEIKLTESKAILKYLAREKLSPGSEPLFPADLESQRSAEVIENVTGELMHSLLIIYCWRMDNEDEKKRLRQQYAHKIKEMSEFLGEKKWILGMQIMYVDFMLYEALYLHSHFNSDCIQPFENLKNYMKRFEKIPSVAKYMESSKYVKEPCNSPAANHPF